MLYFYFHQLNKKEDVENHMLIMFLPAPGPTGPWVSGTKNVKERKIFAAALAGLGLIAAGLIFYITFFVDKANSFYIQQEPTTLMGSFLNTVGITTPFSLFIAVGVLIASIAVSAWVGASEKNIARICSVVFVLLQILIIISAYIPA